MRLPDPIGLREKLKKNSVVFTIREDSVSVKNKHHVFLSEADCFVLSQSLPSLPHGEVAAVLTSSSVLWSINLLKKRHSYWRDKKLVGGRVVRSVNWTLYNKRREVGFEDGLGSTTVVLLFGEKYFFVYGVGLPQAYLLRKGIVIRLTENPRENIVALGVEKNAPKHSFYEANLESTDIFILSSTDIEDCVSESIKIGLWQNLPNNQEELDAASKKLMTLAHTKHITDCMVSIVTYS